VSTTPQELNRAVTQDELRAAAYHEAGHAVAHVALLGSASAIKSVRIRADGSGLVSYARSFRPRREVDEAVIFYAGPVAEARVTGGRPEDIAYRQMDNPTHASDWEMVFQHIAALSVSYPVVTLAYVQQRTEELLTKNWAAVERLAAALLEHRSLAGAQVRELVNLEDGRDTVATNTCGHAAPSTGSATGRAVH
jgi:ATP-dependent Zn protease